MIPITDMWLTLASTFDKYFIIFARWDTIIITIDIIIIFLCVIKFEKVISQMASHIHTHLYRSIVDSIVDCTVPWSELDMGITIAWAV